MRIARLTPAGQAAWRDLWPGRVDFPRYRRAGRYFTDTGLAHPVPPEPSTGPPVVTVIVPVRTALT